MMRLAVCVFIFMLLDVGCVFCQTEDLSSLIQCISNNECEDQYTCNDLACQNPCPGICSVNASCEVHDHVPYCACLPGYSGSPFTGCKIQDKDVFQPWQNSSKGVQPRPDGVSFQRKYLVKKEEVSWYTALERCHRMGMKLISITNSTIQDEIEIALTDSGDRPKRSLWTSASDWSSKGNYVWMETGESLVFTNWQVKEPEVSDRYRCVILERSGSLTWYTGNCNSTINYICEYSLSGQE